MYDEDEDEFQHIQPTEAGAHNVRKKEEEGKKEKKKREKERKKREKDRDKEKDRGETYSDSDYDPELQQLRQLLSLSGPVTAAVGGSRVSVRETT